MTIFEQLTPAQQMALTHCAGDRGTRKALDRMGLIQFEDLSGYKPFLLTDLGRMVLLAHDQVKNTPATFPPGTGVVTLDCSWTNGGLSFHGWLGEVTRAAERPGGMVFVKTPYAEVRRQPVFLARAADVEAAGLMGLVQK